MSPGLFKKPLLGLNRLVGHRSAKNHMSKPTIGNIAALDENENHREIRKVQERQLKELQREEEKKSLQELRQTYEEEAKSEDPPELSAKYGTATGDALREQSEHFLLANFDTSGKRPGETISFNARIHHVRSMSSKLVFIVFRQQIDTIQGVLHFKEGAVSEGFIRWAAHLVPEGIVHVGGTIQSPPETVIGCTIKHAEVLVDTMHLVVPVEDSLPVDVYSIDRVDEDEETHEVEYVASNRVRVANRISYLRTPTMQSVFRINAAVCNIFRAALSEQDFVEIHTPKLQSSATESGAEVFRANYYGREAFLAQSPQLAKQMCISADFGRVFEIGPVFRAEDSNTHRHLSEYTGLDLEMVIEKHYHEVLDVVDEVLKRIFKEIYANHRRELDVIKTHFPHEDLVWTENTPRIPFKEAVRMLNESGWRDEAGNEAPEDEDLSTPAEIRIGQLVKENYGTDYYIIDKFPTSARPFYTQLDPQDEKVTNSFDIFLRGQEITTGGQRINNARVLAERMAKAGIDPSDMEEYMQGFEFGVFPHGGCGVGLERLLFLLLNLGDIRNASLFPRDPKSLQEKKKETAALPHPDADTIRYSFLYAQNPEKVTLPKLENLISNYGDATNTSWLDDRYHVWRHQETGAAVGFAEESGYALIMGNPLCDTRQYPVVIRAFLKHLRKVRDLRPLWLLVSAEVEEILGSRLGWRTLSCVAEDRLEVDNMKKVTKKERQAVEAGVTIHELGLGEPVPDELRERIDKRIEEWKASRKGPQAHITEVRPWIDMEHRRYAWAEDAEGQVAALVILHRLSPEHGYQIKFALNFPGSPNGTIEALITASVQSLAKSGVRCVTFGASAVREVEIGNNLGTIRAKILSRTYRAIAQQLKLVQKGEFREKFGTQDDRVYICYPVLGLGVSGVRTLIGFFEDVM